MRLVGAALDLGDDRSLRSALEADSGLPGQRANLELIAAFADAAAAIASAGERRAGALERLLDDWAALGPGDAPGDQPTVILPCAAVAAYGAVGAARPEWIDDEVAKLRMAASDDRWRVREMVAAALQRLLAVDWPGVLGVLATWAAAEDPLVVRAAVAAVAEPSLLDDSGRAAAAHRLQGLAVERYAGEPRPRRSEPSRALRKGLGHTISVTVAATGDFALLDELAISGDPDLRWIAAQNATKARLRRWPAQLDRLRRLLAPG